MRTKAVISQRRTETPTVKSFVLSLEDPRFSFLAGQWVDLYALVEGAPMVGGFSITSSPTRLGTIELAVRDSGRNPVARHLHQRARVGETVEVDGGHGGFYFRRGMAASLTLIAGGIGITPLMSMLRYVDDAAPEVAVTVVMSARAPSELLFKDDIQRIAARRPNTRAFLTVSRPGDEPWSGRVGRIDAAWLRDIALDRGSLFYLCGPPGMPEHLAGQIAMLGVPGSRILFEQWW